MLFLFSPSEAKQNPLLKRFEVQTEKLDKFSRISMTNMLTHIGACFPNLEEFIVHFVDQWRTVCI